MRPICGIGRCVSCRLLRELHTACGIGQHATISNGDVEDRCQAISKGRADEAEGGAPGFRLSLYPRIMVNFPQLINTVLDTPDVRELAEFYRQLELGAERLFDRTDDPDEPLYVYADPAGHPFCIFIN